MYQHLRCYSGSLDYAAVRCQIPLQYSDTSGLGVRIFHRTDDFRILVYTILNILAYGSAVCCQTIEVQKSLLGQFIITA